MKIIDILLLCNCHTNNNNFINSINYNEIGKPEYLEKILSKLNESSQVIMSIMDLCRRPVFSSLWQPCYQNVKYLSSLQIYLFNIIYTHR